jgi:hypothetical protein
MKRMSLLVMTTIACSGAAGPAYAGRRDHVCVGDGRGCYATVQAAVDAAPSGATIEIGRGTFKGGITIDKNLTLAGAGARSTTIRGGGPVITIGRYFAASEPEVTIAGVTVTGGSTRTSALAKQRFGDAGVFALGGGIEIPPSADFGAGATVTVRDSAITGNTALPSSSVPSGMACASACPFALAAGAGIDSWGPLTVVDSTIADNLSGGPLTSDADAGGIHSAQGGLTLKRTVVSRNRAVAVPPYGRFTAGGGIIVTSRPFFVGGDRPPTAFVGQDVVVEDNRADLSSAFSSDVESHAQSGGILIGGDDDCTDQPASGCVEAMLRDTRVSGNSTVATNTIGDANAFGGGINNDGLLTLSDSTLDGNHVAAKAPAASAFADSGGLGMGGAATIAGSRLIGNTVSGTAPTGFVLALSGGIGTGNPGITSTVVDSVVAGNRVTARTTSGGSLFAGGGGIGNLGMLKLRRTHVDGNAVVASGGEGAVHGGGLLNTKFPDAPDTASMTVTDSAVTRNTISGSDGIELAGGGIFSEQPLALTTTLIARNAPDQCSGC